MRTTKILAKRIADVFRSSSPDHVDMQVQVARLSVLYEDLRIEYSAAEQESLPSLDRTSVDTRRFYFVRRTLATLTEIEGALNKLNANKEFKPIRASMSTVEAKAWDGAIRFFNMKHKFLKDWRNDVGGHFLDAAAKYAIENIDASTVGTIELYRRGNGADVRMKFAYELVTVAMTKNHGPKDELQFLEDAFSFLADAVGHAVAAIHILTNRYLYDRFR